MRTMVIITVMVFWYFLIGCASEVNSNGGTDTLYIDQKETEYDNEVQLVFTQKGEYTMYDVESGNLVYTRYKDKSVWLGEGYDTVNITVPDTVITFREDISKGDAYIHTNTFQDGTYLYKQSGGWDWQMEDPEGLM